MDLNDNKGTKLNPVTTVVKDNLPTQQDIDAEKHQADGNYQGTSLPFQR